MNLLYDSGRKVLENLLKLGNLSGHRQLKSLLKKWKRVYRVSSEIHRKKGKNYQPRLKNSVISYLKLAKNIESKVQKTLTGLLGRLQSGDLDKKTVILLQEQEPFLRYLKKHIDLVDRRLLKGETILHQEKVFSVFEDHVEWISKGKAGKAVEFGHRHLIYSDQYNFVLHQKVLVGQTDKEVALEQGKMVVEQYGTTLYNYVSLSYDRGFYSSLAKQKLSKVYNQVVMPKAGKKTQAQLEEESSDEYIALRHLHSGVEANINSLEHTGLAKCRNKGLPKFKNYAALGVIAHNIGNLGKWLFALEKKQKTKKAA